MSIRTAVVGVGSMGNNHARILSDLAGVDLQCIVDTNAELGEKMAKKYGTNHVFSIEEAVKKYDVKNIVIATPTSTHFTLAQQALALGCNIFLEKPAFKTVEEGEAFVKLVEEYNNRSVIMVGHIERFNPAVNQLKELILAGELGEIYQIDIRRQGPFPTRIADVGVVLDLCVHDLDILRYLTDSEIKRMAVEASQNLHTSHEDMIVAILRLSNGTQATLNINWLTPTKNRDIFVICSKGLYQVNLLTQDLYFYENSANVTNHWENITLLRGVTEGKMTKFLTPKKEPLRLEHECFLETCKTGEYPHNFVSLKDGIEAVRLAEQMLETMQK
ncbi:Gfo/Idh/MocA family oxidoreductase [Acinetobacter sp. c1-l78]|uniref:Gfo/Idh/MocA family oxidoreductase n=1 Tax=Acinetobacter sp. c1-l78 TaxID=3342803 RepID=UPI0035BA9658